ncbi:uncharacterized protein LOC143592450 [Bidens hawaiensis]|uniref:uncharacterized protein LOC143592450 n=1 Tax=Bidens hawaiensis TaxID=980011 RepID=UPI0040490A24
MEKYREKMRDLHMVFIDLEKAYDSVLRRLLWDSLKGRGVPEKYVDIVHDMYARTETSVRAPVGDIASFPVEIGLHQDDIVLVAESKHDLNMRLEEWRAALEKKGLRMSRSKPEYLHCPFSGANDEEEVQITIEGQVVP